MMPHATSMDTKMDTFQLDLVVHGHYVDYIRIYGIVC